jgi:hypothetical protein
MRKYITIICIYLTVSGCQKNPFDYRSKFTGNYTFTIHSKSYWGIPPNATITDTTYSYNGKIELGSEPNIISIAGSEFVIYEDGTIIGSEHVVNGCKGEFESPQKVSYSCHSGGLGVASNYTVTGVKK